VYNSSPD